MSFTFVERPSDSDFVQAVWLNQSERAESFISPAAIHWEMVIARHQGKTTFTVRGPESKASLAPIPGDADWLGITFKLGTFMPAFRPGSLLDHNDVHLPQTGDNRFWLDGSTWELPTYENADVFIKRLVQSGLILRDPLVDDVMRGYPHDLSPRGLQYRLQRTTGLTYKTIQQIGRARQAAVLLEQGIPILDTAHSLGYFDQAHLTNSLRRYMGQTPTQILPNPGAVTLCLTDYPIFDSAYDLGYVDPSHLTDLQRSTG